MAFSATSQCLLQPRLVAQQAHRRQLTTQPLSRPYATATLRRAHQHAGVGRLAAAATEQQREPAWENQWGYLVNEKGFSSIQAEEAQELVDSGDWLLLDVRPRGDYDKSHPAGAVSVPLFQAVDWSKPDVKRYLRAFAMAVNGVSPVEPNPEFLAEVARAAGGKGVVLLCETGGTLEPSTNFARGKTSRSLKATYRIISAGTLPQSKVAHLAGGAYGWFRAGLPFEGEYDLANVGRTPSAAEEPTGQYITGNKKDAR